MDKKGTDRLVLSVKEARQQLGLSRGLMYDALRSGQIPSIRIGRRILIPRASLDRLLEGTDTTNTRCKPQKTGG